ncbi:hypothetical protein, conserved [Babesia ovata]|uniref:Uncharacterized protein n=1 Tax=Babesia ovata TaxID=189622 RepID=A0A2H6KDU2_9APIC|nr:uncharacterized protein BOVATA_026560 [Babesia ovata]GBE61163.1 hypothetical protein, conserved [Babesia ovata]
MEEPLETEISEPAGTLTEPDAAADADTDLSDVSYDTEAKPEDEVESQAYVRRTRWASALMDGVDPRLRFANKRFSDIYEQPEDTEAKKTRRTKSAPDLTTEEIVAVQPDPTYSEDDCDTSPSSDIRTIRDILNAIRDVVTALIPQPELGTDAPIDQIKEQKQESVYGTRSASARSHDSINTNADTAATGTSGRASDTEYMGMCDDVRTLQKDVGDLLHREMYTRDEKLKFLVYSIIELVALRADHYYRMIQNMERLARYAWRTESIPTEFVTSLIDIYGTAALQHLEHIRRRMPIKVRHTGVLNFRPWRAIFGGRTLSMEDLNDLLAKYEFKKLKDTVQMRATEVRLLIEEHRRAMLKAIEARNTESMLAASYAKLRRPGTQQKGEVTPAVSTAANTQESISDAMLAAENAKAGTGVERGKSGIGGSSDKDIVSLEKDSASDAYDSGQPQSPSSRRGGGRRGAAAKGESSRRPGKSKSLELERPNADDSDGPLTRRKHGSAELTGMGLFTENDEAAFSEYSDEGRGGSDSTKSVTSRGASANRSKSKSQETANESPQVGTRGMPDRAAIARRIALNRSLKNAESWRNLKMTNSFEPVKLDGDDSFKIPKVKRDATPKATPTTEETPSRIETPKAAEQSPTATVETPKKPLEKVVYETNRIRDGPRSASFSPPSAPYRHHSDSSQRRSGPNSASSSPTGRMFPMYMIPPPPPHPNMLMFHNAMYNALAPHPKGPWAVPPVVAPVPHMLSPKQCHPLSPSWRSQGSGSDGRDSPGRDRGFTKRHHQMSRNTNRRQNYDSHANSGSPRPRRVV